MDALNHPRPDWMTEDLVLLEEQARRFITDEFGPHIDRWHEAGIYERDVWTKAGQAGLLCAAMPEEYGGAGGSFAHEAVINRELSLAGFDSFGAPLHSGIVAPYILHYGTEEQKKRWLPKLATGEMVGAIAMTEPGTGSDLQGVRTKAEKSGNGYVLNGSKTFITNGQHTNLIIVVAKPTPRPAPRASRCWWSRPTTRPASVVAASSRSSAWMPPTPRNCSSRTCVCPPRVCWGPRKGRASIN